MAASLKFGEYVNFDSEASLKLWGYEKSNLAGGGPGVADAGVRVCVEGVVGGAAGVADAGVGVGVEGVVGVSAGVADAGVGVGRVGVVGVDAGVADAGVGAEQQREEAAGLRFRGS